MIEYIVFSGGAQRGNAFIGALAVLFDYMKLVSFQNEFKGFGGTSIGALLAFACTIGIQPNQMKQWALEQDTSDFIQQMGISTFFTNRGLLPQTYLYKHILNLSKISPLFANQINMNTTFKELYEMTHKILRVTASNLSQQKEVILDYETTPHYSVVQAIATSMSIPILFEPTIVNPESHIYIGGTPYDCITDGGAYQNYPITLFPIEKTIGFQLSLGFGASTRFGHSQLFHRALSKEFSIPEYLGNIIMNTVDFYEQKILTMLPAIYSARTVSLVIPNCSFKELISAPKTLMESYIFFAEMTMLFYCFPMHCIYTLFIAFCVCKCLQLEYSLFMKSKNECNQADLQSVDDDESNLMALTTSLQKKKLDNMSMKEELLK
jgi:predicted acylesterase/phospholipase RssA